MRVSPPPGLDARSGGCTPIGLAVSCWILSLRGPRERFDMSIRTLAARYVFPVARDPIEGGTVLVENGRIVDVTRGQRRGEFDDLGNVAIVPGLVNAHSHLDLSGFDHPLGERGIGLPAWVRKLLQARGSTDARVAVRRGLEESGASGVVGIGDIAQPGWSAEPLTGLPIEPVVFLELIGPTAARRDSALELARRHIEACRPGCGWRAGLSPHAPYSVRRDLLEAVVAVSARQQVPLAFHLAESREELELLRSGAGPLREMLDDLGAWEPRGLALASRPLDYLRLLADARRALVIHGNYLVEEEIDYLGQHAERMAVVYCPRTHAWFGHAAYPLESLLAAGALVALGTDSRASSPDLSLWADMREAGRRHPMVARQDLLRMATLNGARALGLDDTLGTLEPGKAARLAIVPLPAAAGDPYDLLFDEATHARGFAGSQP